MFSVPNGLEVLLGRESKATEYDAISLDHVASWKLTLKMSPHNDKDSALL